MPSTILVCGKGRIATAALSFTLHHARLHSLPSRVLACPNTDDRGYDGWQESLTRAADALGVARVALEEVEGDPGLLLVSLEYDRLIRVDRFASRRVFNIHFSALPKYRGVYTSIWPILRGEEESGVTLHYMDRGADTGPLVAQRRFPLPGWLTARRLYELYLDEGLALFREWLPRLITTIPEPIVQDESQASAFNRKSLDLSRRELDLTRGAAELSTFVRAYAFPEYQLPTLRGRGVRACTPLHGRSGEAPGTLLHATAFSSSYVVGGGEVVEVIWG